MAFTSGESFRALFLGGVGYPRLKGDLSASSSSVGTTFTSMLAALAVLLGFLGGRRGEKRAVAWVLIGV